MKQDDFESIHNYYERLVLEEVVRVAGVRGERVDRALLADVACVALNHLPPRYIRYDVDFSFYLTTREREQNAHAVADAVAQAYAYVLSRTQRPAA